MTLTVGTSHSSLATLQCQLPHGTSGYHTGLHRSRKRATDLSVMMLGFTVTTSVFTPTSMVYFSEMGGRLHLWKRQGSPTACGQSFPMEWGVGKGRGGRDDHMREGCGGGQLCGLGTEGPIQPLPPPILSSPITKSTTREPTAASAQVYALISHFQPIFIIQTKDVSEGPKDKRGST